MIIKFNNPKNLEKTEFIDLFHPGKKIKQELLISDVLTKTIEGFELKDQSSPLIPYKSSIDVLYEDDHVVVVFKPSGMLVHSDGVVTTDTLLNRVVYYYHGKIDVKVIHRIDVDTSGIVLFSKNKLSHAFLNYQMENGLIKKEYTCITHGKFKEQKGIIDKPIGSNRHENNKYLVTKNGKKAITNYEVVESKKDMNLVRVELITGRTHQIRVHMSSINCPYYSDKIYYQDEGMPLQLMSSSISFINPGTFTVTTVNVRKGLELWKK